MAFESVTQWTGVNHLVNVVAAMGGLAIAVAIHVSVTAWCDVSLRENRQLVADIATLRLQYESERSQLEHLLSPDQLELWAVSHDMVKVDQRNVWRLP